MTVLKASFHNAYGEEWVVEYNKDTDKLTLTGDDAGDINGGRIPLDRDFGTPLGGFILSHDEQEMVYSLIEELTGSFPFDMRSSYELLKSKRYVDITFTKEEWSKKVEKLSNPKNCQSHSWKNIFEYWEEHPFGKFLFLPSRNLPKLHDYPITACMACGSKEFILERAHIKPKRLGGTNKLENIHALCYYCHQASENLSGGIYWLFITQRRYIDTLLQLFNKPYGSQIKKRKDGTTRRKYSPQTEKSVYPHGWLNLSMGIRARDGKELDDWFLFAGEHETDNVPLEEWQEQMEIYARGEEE